ncbi:GNAT family N-acetyltransferase [Ideonella sp.]|uniref:GNAT family N-acetyltransferase n=1 Tax=Ideonella sp. TaxID=1929293 RepID=UPI0035B1C5DF
MTAPTVRRLGPDDAAAFQALRLQGLLECPSAFASSHAEEVTLPMATVAERLAGDGPLGVYGAFDATGRLVGVACLGRESMAKLAHKAVLWGMYVEPAARRQGLAGRLVAEVLAQARRLAGVRQVTLGVESGNTAARALYASLGFVAWGTEPAATWADGRAFDETWMVCALAEPPAATSAAAARPALAVMIHSADPEGARAWYQRLWPQAQAVHVAEPQPFDLLLHDGVQLEFVPADAKVASGAAGSVVYWPVDDFEAMRTHAEALGAQLYRGPMRIDAGRTMAQFKDPWGNLFGLRGA